MSFTLYFLYSSAVTHLNPSLVMFVIVVCTFDPSFEKLSLQSRHKSSYNWPFCPAASWTKTSNSWQSPSLLHSHSVDVSIAHMIKSHYRLWPVYVSHTSCPLGLLSLCFVILTPVYHRHWLSWLATDFFLCSPSMHKPEPPMHIRPALEITRVLLYTHTT